MSWLRRHLDSLLVVSALLMLLGAWLLSVADANRVVVTLGGATLGAGLTILITDLTSRRSIHEQYAKEANLRRKDDLYGPLYGEIKALREILQRAYDEDDTYPQRITFIKWPTFKQGYYWNDFTESARHILDHMLELANVYNQTVSKAPAATIEVLSAEIEQAIQQTKASDEYIAWQEKLKNYPTERIYNMALRQGGVQPPWFQRLTAVPPQTETLGLAWARSWITSWPIQHEPPTIGFLLAGDASAAARTIYTGYQPGGDPPPPIQWIEDIFQRAMPKLEALASYQEARVAYKRLYIAVCEAEQMLLSALNDIQRRYEGGRPPL